MEKSLALESVTLPYSHVALPNRIIKAAMYEHLAHILGGPPNEHHFEVYREWNKYDWGALITGNVQTSPTHLTLGRDMVSPSSLSEEDLLPYRTLRNSMKERIAIVQLSHTGRQAANLIGGRFPGHPPLAPSAVRVKGKNETAGSDFIHSIIFQNPKAMNIEDIDIVYAGFVQAAKAMHLTGFDGVQLHMAHGYLLSEFLSPATNLRTDEYSCATPENALRLLHKIVTTLRAELPHQFIVAVKFSTENTTPAEESRALDYIRTMVSWELLDFVEISGGDYTNPEFMTKTPSKSARQALFASFSRKAKAVVDESSASIKPLIMLTGGINSAALCHSALSHNDADLVGIGRCAVLSPDFPNQVEQRSLDDAQPIGDAPASTDSYIFNNLLPRVNLLGAGTSMAWYGGLIRRLSQHNAKRPGTGLAAVWDMWSWWAPERPTIVRRGLAFLGLLVFVISLVLKLR
ncbi:FMN-linked oxidoreductase [Cylindrobasidium torrendii FP15055 ss-10]|uniref:FMN-linked oxidoreductase n=1 Tax=Cylindrobasidium torrendii FP15055 ss-10 TaxID=1314674 RepID=A0A0D7B481_9AGAR|nr:FMN-linked oxidoreductase [Cylindrobasidium torrendii FP15055 ss-10]